MPEAEHVGAVIVGAGPAGVAAAVTLARAGRQAVLIDKATFPRDKICGDGLTTGALRELADLGLSPDAVASWIEVSDVYVTSPSGREVCFPMPRGHGTYAAVARRADLDAALVELARAAGVDVREGCELLGATVTPGGTSVTLDTSGGPIGAQIAIGADGMWSPLRKAIGAETPGYLGEWHAFRQYFTDVGPRAAKELFVWFEPDLLPGYAWSFPLPGNVANVGFGILRGGKVKTKEMKALWPALLARPHIAEVLGPAASPESPHRAWPIPARIDTITAASGPVLFVGDAVAATDVMTGEGIGQALLTGRLAAEAIIAGGSSAEIARRYEQAVRDALVADHRMSALLGRALKHRKGARVAVRIAGASAWTRRNFARWLFEDYPRAIAVTPRRWHKGMFHGDGARFEG